MKRFLKEDEGGKSLVQMFVLVIFHLLGLFSTVYQTDNKYGYDTFVLN